MRKVVVLFLALVASCSDPSGRVDDGSIKIVLEEGGSAQSWHVGDRAAVEGKLIETDLGDYVVVYTTSSRFDSREFCGILRGVGSYWSPLRWEALTIAGTGRPVTVIGKTADERFPTYRLTGGGRHSEHMCDFAVETERIDYR